jgi:hypothetical protein
MKLIKRGGKVILDYQPEPGDFFDYFSLRKEETGLNHILMCDSSQNYKRLKHPLWLYVEINENSDLHYNYYTRKYIVFTIDDNPRIIGNVNDINISVFDLLKIKRYIITNKKPLIDVANYKLREDQYVYQSLPYSVILNESLHKEKGLIIEDNLFKSDTGLNTNVWIDKRDVDINPLQHAERLKIQNNYGDHITKNDFISMGLYDLRVYAKSGQKIKITNADIDLVRKFISHNEDMLTNKDKLFDFKKENVVKIDKKGNPVNLKPESQIDYWKKEYVGYGLTVVQREHDNLLNIIDKTGKLLFNEWFGYYSYFQNGFMDITTLNGNGYKIDTNGKIFNI